MTDVPATLNRSSRGITFSGGDPLHPANSAGVRKLMEEIREKFPGIKAHIHSPADQRLDGLHIVVDGIFHILDLTAVAKIPETILHILLLNGSDVLRHMTVEVLKSATASFGITALNELQELYNGKSLVEDGRFALEVMEYINAKVNEFKEADGYLYAISFPQSPPFWHR